VTKNGSQGEGEDLTLITGKNEDIKKEKALERRRGDNGSAGGKGGSRSGEESSKGNNNGKDPRPRFFTNELVPPKGNVDERVTLKRTKSFSLIGRYCEPVAFENWTSGWRTTGKKARERLMKKDSIQMGTRHREGWICLRAGGPGRGKWTIE